MGFADGLADGFEGVVDLAGFEGEGVGEVVGADAGFGEDGDAASFFGGFSEVEEGALEVTFDGLGPVELGAGDLECFGGFHGGNVAVVFVVGILKAGLGRFGLCPGGAVGWFAGWGGLQS